MLLATLLLMGVASTGIGLLPTYASVGVWAPVMLIGLRMLQGLGAGAEQAGAAVLMTEYAPGNRRGFFAALPFMGIQLGTVAAALVYFVVLKGVENIADTWLWRLPFLFSVVIIGVAVWIRLELKESPEFAKLEARSQVADRPLANLLRTSTRTALLVFGLRVAENGGSSILQSLAISYVVGVVGLPGQAGTLALFFAGLVGAVVVPLTGLMTDRLGRVVVYRWYAIYQLVVSFPLWWVLSQGDPTACTVAIPLALVGVWGMFTAQGALLPELFGARHRYIGVAVGREISAVFAGDVAPLVGAFIIDWVTSRYGGTREAGLVAWVPLAAQMALLSLVAVVTTFYGPKPGGATSMTCTTPGRRRDACAPGNASPRSTKKEAGMKPEILLTEAMMPELEAKLDAAYTVHRLAQATDRAAFLAEVAPGVRAVATGGGTGASNAMVDAPPKLEIIAINGAGTDAVDLLHEGAGRPRQQHRRTC